MAAAAGLAVRVATALAWRPCPGGLLPDPIDEGGACLSSFGDSSYYHDQARLLAGGQLFGTPHKGPVSLDLGPGGYHPPLFTTLLALFDVLGLRSYQAQRIGLAVVGAAGVVLIGLVAQQLTGRARAGVVAAAIAAVHPLLVVNDVRVMSESLYVPLVAAVVLVALRCRAQPAGRTAVLLGVLLAAAALTRTEALLLVPVVGLVAVGKREAPLFGRQVHLAVPVVVVSVLLVLPWVTFNLSRFRNTTLLTTGASEAVYVAANDRSTTGPDIGLFCYECSFGERNTLPAGTDESDYDVLVRRKARDFWADHLHRVPAVAAARLARTWELFDPGGNVEATIRYDNRPPVSAWGGLVVYYLTAAGAVAGLVVARRRRLPVGPVVGVLVVTCVLVVLAYSVTRFRSSADAMLVVLTAVAVDAALDRFTARRSGSTL